MTAAAACCTIDLECVGPLGSTKGLSDAKTTYFYRPSHAGARVVVHLAPDRSRKEPANTKASQPTMWKREVEIDMERRKIAFGRAGSRSALDSDRAIRTCTGGTCRG